MPDLPTSNELAEIARSIIRTKLDPAGTGAVDLRPGSRNDAAVSLQTGQGARLSAYVADRISAGFTSQATDDDLDVRGEDLYKEPRKQPSFATGKVRLVRAGSSATTIPKGTRVAVPAAGTQAAVVFAATSDVASSTTTAIVPVTCVETGPRGNITGPQAVTAILDPLPDTTWALDATYTVGVDPNAAFGGGANRENDDEYKQRLDQLAIDDPRVRAVYRALLRAALRATGVRYVTLVEPLDGTVVVFAGDDAFVLTEAMRASIDSIMLDWRAYGMPVLVRPYAVQTVTVTATVHMARALANYDQAAIKSAAINAVKKYFLTARPTPDEYFKNAIEAAMLSAHDEAQDVVMTSPNADVLRPTDAGYGAITALNRYRVTDASLNISIAGPRTA